MTTPGDQVPTLGGIDLGDDQVLAQVVDAYVYRLTQTDPDLRDLREELRDLEDDLRAAGPEVWSAYLAVEEVRNARTSELLLQVVRWAFNEGARCARRDGGGL